VGVDQHSAVAKWGDVHYYSPAPRHRRRLILKWIADLQFHDVLDVGCAQPFLLHAILKRHRVAIYGSDLSSEVIAQNQRMLPEAQFETFDLASSRYPNAKTFDLVICSEVIEHIRDWKTALANVAAMARRYLLVTVPSGHVYPIDQYIGHFRHFSGPELNQEIERLGFSLLRFRHWGVPVHSLYKFAINSIRPQTMYNAFGESAYGFWKQAFAALLYLLFFLNDPFDAGGLYLVVAERR
jgi:SAM-dependent methyltransferase